MQPHHSYVASSPHVASNDDLQATLTKQFESLYQRIDSDRRVQDAAGAAKQDAILRLVSSTLTENVEKSLHRIVSESMANEIVPSITNNIVNVNREEDFGHPSSAAQFSSGQGSQDCAATCNSAIAQGSSGTQHYLQSGGAEGSTASISATATVHAEFGYSGVAKDDVRSRDSHQSAVATSREPS